LVWSKKYLFVSFCWVQVFFPLIYLSVHCSYLFYSRFCTNSICCIFLYWGVITSGLLAFWSRPPYHLHCVLYVLLNIIFIVCDVEINFEWMNEWIWMNGMPYMKHWDLFYRTNTISPQWHLYLSHYLSANTVRSHSPATRLNGIKQLLSISNFHK